jgi:membrane associated rhomboid family serine protease
MIPLRDNVPRSRPPVVTWSIIAACVAVFVWQLYQPHLGQAQMFVPHSLLEAQSWQGHGPLLLLRAVFLSMFMHGGLLHIGFNMLFLAVFGDNVEDRMGSPKFLGFYLLCGLIASLGHSVMSGFSSEGIVGASGAIAGVMGGYYVLFKGAKVKTLLPICVLWTIVDVPAVIFIGFWFVVQVYEALVDVGGHVAFWAHIAGFLAGALLVKWFVGKPRFHGPRVIKVKFD